MKQKLARRLRTRAEPGVLFADEPTTGVDPVSRASFGTRWPTSQQRADNCRRPHSYFDEAERCHRVALMHAGHYSQIGRRSTAEQPRLVRLELFYASTRRAEFTALRNMRATVQLWTVQRFGDRLDLLGERPEEAKLIVADAWRRPDSTARKSAPICQRSKNVSLSHYENSARKSTPCPFHTGAIVIRLHGQVPSRARFTKEFGGFSAVRI